MPEAGSYQTLTHNLTKHYIASVSSDSLSYKFVVIRGGKGGDPCNSPHLQRLGVVGASLRAGSASSC
jgi:hypothetical protein